MRFEPTVLLSLFGATAAHYTFNSLILNGQITPQWQYVRRHNRGIDPTRGVDRANVASVHFRCNLDALGAGPSTQVAPVSPGQRIGFKSYYGEIEHPGPLLIYMSRAPGNVQNYDGSGDWFKVHEEYVCGDLSNGLQDTDWCTWDRNEFFFTIPQQTPPGDYLVRVEHIALHGAWGDPNAPEFYMACAQIRVSGSGSGSPGPLVRIPGAYNLDDPAFRFNIYNGPRDYPYTIGPAVWNGGGSSPPSSTSNPGGCSALYGQCGGNGWNGPTCCSQGTCQASNEWYSQCV